MPTPLLSLADVVKDTLYDVMHILLFAGICVQNLQERQVRNKQHIFNRGNRDPLLFFM